MQNVEKIVAVAEKLINLAEFRLQQIIHRLNPLKLLKRLIIWLLRIPTPLVVLIYNTFKYLRYIAYERKYYKSIDGNILDIDTNSSKLAVLLFIESRLPGNPNIPGIQIFKNLGFQIISVVVSDAKLPDEYFEPLENIGTVFRRQNVGYDFGGYKHLLSVLENQGALAGVTELLLINDSTFFPAKNPGPFLAWMESDYHLGGATMSYEKDYGPHVQSYFYHFKGKGVHWISEFLQAYKPISSRPYAVSKGEVEVFQKAVKDGLSVDSFIDLYRLSENDRRQFYTCGNPMHAAVPLLMQEGLPFIKYDLVTKKINPLMFVNLTSSLPDDSLGLRLLKKFVARTLVSSQNKFNAYQYLLRLYGIR